MSTPNPKNRILTVTEFARLAGVYPNTVRNYQRRGLIPDRRNPLNGYRIFTIGDVEKIKKLMRGETRGRRRRPT